MRRFFPHGLLVSLAFVGVLAGCSATDLERGALSVEARIAVANASRAVQHETLYLLDADPIGLAMAEADEGDAVQVQTHREHPRLRTLAKLMNARRFAGYPLGPDIALLFEQSKPLWEKHVVRTARTDDEGRAVFDRVAPGDYWLTCLSERDGNVAFWNSPVTVGSRAQVVVLDERNALSVSDSSSVR